MSKRQEEKRRTGIVSMFEKKLWQSNYQLCKSQRGEACEHADSDCPHRYTIRGIWLHWLGNKRK
jgi:hypothetical protein